MFGGVSEQSWAPFHGSAYRQILRLRSWFPGYLQASNFCASLVSVDCLVMWSTHEQKPRFVANPWNTLVWSTEFAASVNADSVVTVSRAMKMGLGLLLSNHRQIWLSLLTLFFPSEKNNEINALDFSLDGDVYATAGKDLCVRIYDAETHEVCTTVLEPQEINKMARGSFCKTWFWLLMDVLLGFPDKN